MQISHLILALIAVCNNGINAKPPSKIVGGYEVNITKGPFMAMVFRWINSTYQTQCGGSLITNRHILTAAHCLDNPIDNRKRLPLKSFMIVVGETFYHPGARIYKVEKVYQHPNYTPPSFGLPPEGIDLPDIGIIKLKTNLQFGPTKSSIELAKKKPPSPAIGFSYGWGTTDPDVFNYPQSLQQIMLKVHNSTDCAILYPGIPFNEDELCTRAFWFNGGVCHGDSGGPLIINGELAAVYSSSKACELGYFIDIFPYKAWIEKVVKDAIKSEVYPKTDATYSTHDMQILRPSTKFKEPSVRDELKK